MPGLVEIEGLGHRYGGVTALTDINLSVPEGGLTGVLGPDGVGKSTLLSLIAGVTRIQTGSIRLFGGGLTRTSHRRTVYGRIGFMPQGLGQNLYGDLSVEENIRFFGSLFGIAPASVDARMDALLAATDLTAFARRRAADLSGGMKQKLGLCTILIHEPDLLILDEPTTGVDPLSRRNFWRLIRAMVRRNARSTVLAATAYMEEAADFDWLVMMDARRIIDTGTPAALKRKAQAETLDDAYVVLLSGADGAGSALQAKAQRAPNDREIVIEATNLTRRFDSFTAVDRVNFQIRRGEIYGFIGPNGCGKTTTMKMLTGLLPPSAGTARIFGREVSAGATEWQRRLGYMSQQFSLYSELTVGQNLVMHGRLFDLKPRELTARVRDMARELELSDLMDHLASDLPVGIRQRLSLAVAIIHRPEILVLDEPTSGVDPVARDRLWAILHTLSQDHGTTIFVSTHYLGEAERCDRIALMNQGRLLAVGTPQALLDNKNTDRLEDAFVAYIEDDQARNAGPSATSGTRQ